MYENYELFYNIDSLICELFIHLYNYKLNYYEKNHFIFITSICSM